MDIHVDWIVLGIGLACLAIGGLLALYAVRLYGRGMAEFNAARKLLAEAEDIRTEYLKLRADISNAQVLRFQKRPAEPRPPH